MQLSFRHLDWACRHYLVSDACLVVVRCQWQIFLHLSLVIVSYPNSYLWCIKMQKTLAQTSQIILIICYESNSGRWKWEMRILYANTIFLFSDYYYIINIPTLPLSQSFWKGGWKMFPRFYLTYSRDRNSVTILLDNRGSGNQGRFSMVLWVL